MFLRNSTRLLNKINFKCFSPPSTAFRNTPLIVTKHNDNSRNKRGVLCPPKSQKKEAEIAQQTSANVKESSVAPVISGLKRAERSGKCRMGFIPDDWFTFFHIKTGVTGGYLFMLMVGNYCVSKEILVMEHEYYGGLSWFVVIYFISTRFGKKIGANLDKQVDAVVAEYEHGRKMEMAVFESMIEYALLAQKQALGQECLMMAKKENILMQLEAIYRDRAMHVYRTVRGRMDYHVKLYYAQTRIHQKWMIEWILQKVMKSINEAFEKQALDQAIKDLERAASRA